MAAVLPAELLEPILLLACDLHGPIVSQTLALVSKRVCALTAPARFKTVVVRTETALLRFWSLCAEHQVKQLLCDEWRLPSSYARALASDTSRWLDILGRSEQGSKSASQLAELQQQLATQCVLHPADRWRSDGAETAEDPALEELFPPAAASTTSDSNLLNDYLSLPGEKPLTHYVQNLLIDLQPHSDATKKPPEKWTAADARRSTLPPLTDALDLDDGDEAESYAPAAHAQGSDKRRRGDIIALMDEVDALRGLVAQTMASALELKHGCPASFAQKLRELPDRYGYRMCHILERMPNLERLSLGGAECQAFRGSFSCETLQPRELTFVYNGDEELLQDLVKSSSQVVPVGTTPLAFAMVGIRRRLRKLHVIGIDTRSPLTGIAMPVTQLEALRAGSIAPQSYIDHTCTLLQRSEASLAVEKRIKGGTRPEYCTGVEHMRYDTRKFGFRPVEITATRLRLLVQELQVKAFEPDDGTAFLTQVDARLKRESSFYDTMALWGVGAFQKLQLAWQSRADAERLSSLSAARKARFSDISSTVAEAAAKAAKVAGPQSEAERRRQAGVSSKSKAGSRAVMQGGWPREIKDVWTERSDRDLNPTFGHELVEAIRQLYGWSVPPQSETTFLASIREGLNATTTQQLSSIAAVINGLIGPPPADEQGDPPLKLCFGVRMPATFMRFEGEAAFEKVEREALFLDSCTGGRGAWG